MTDHTPEQIARAFAIADQVMFELLECECLQCKDGKLRFLQSTLDLEAHNCPGLREAFEWLQPRGYVELGQDEHGEYINVIRRPAEE
jgi:hypothetical protein